MVWSVLLTPHATTQEVPCPLVPVPLFTMGDQLKYRGQLVAHEDWVTSIAATSEVRD